MRITEENQNKIKLLCNKTTTLKEICSNTDLKLGQVYHYINKNNLPYLKEERIKDLTGKKFGLLLVLNPSFKRTKNNKIRWNCKCDCGNYYTIIGNSLCNGNTKSCGCLNSENTICRNKKRCRENSDSWKGYYDIPKSFFNRIKKDAIKRKREFSLTIEFLWELFIKQNKKCALSNVELKFQSANRIYDGTASLDRIDSTKGYIESNVQWVHKEMNFIKSKYSENVLFEWIKKVYEFKKLNDFNP